MSFRWPVSVSNIVYIHISIISVGVRLLAMKEYSTAHKQNVKYVSWPKQNCNKKKIILFYCQPQAKAKAKAMPGRLYIHT